MWPNNAALKIVGRNAVSQMHSGFFALRSEMPMNCRANQRNLIITPACKSDIDKIQALWAGCLGAADEAGHKEGYLLGDFSIAGAFFAPVVVRLRGC